MSLYSVEVESFKKLIDATNLVVGLVTSKKNMKIPIIKCMYGQFW